MKTEFTLTDFIEQFDKDDSYILLEGKRTVIEAEKVRLVALGKLLASKTEKMIFRSGNAKGSDQLFCDGVCQVDKTRLQLITPYTKHRKKYNNADETISLDEINLTNEPEVVYQSKSNKKTEKLIDQYVSGARDRFTIKASYIIRDTIKVIGTENIKPATFGIFYDDLSDPMAGGTGHTMKVCLENNIPAIDQGVWFSWLDK